jgi:pimeloyl-ACP methyl ester carboxylesterase
MDHVRYWSAALKLATETREIVTVAVDGMCLRGTHHRSRKKLAPARSERSRRIGVLFPNSGVMPRTATGDSAVYWADSFATVGYPSFRFDLAGLGDSDGQAPSRVLDFLARVNTGSYAPQICTIARSLTDRFDLSSVLLVAHCGGTVSAMYAAAASKEVKGLVLMDPYFHLQEAGGQRSLAGVAENGLPRNANLPLIDCWNQLSFSGTPILVLTAPSFKAKGGGFDFLDYLLSTSDRGNIAVQPIEDTPHSFAEGPGKEAVRKHIERWLDAWFPLAGSSSAVQNALELSALGSS